MAGKRAFRLRSVQDVSVYVARLINRVERGEVDPTVAGRLGYLSNILKGCIEVGDLEARVARLERQVEEGYLEPLSGRRAAS